MIIEPLVLNGRPHEFAAAQAASHLTHVHRPLPAWQHVRNVRLVTRRKAQGHR